MQQSPSSADDKYMPKSIQSLADEMRKSYSTGESWWVDSQLEQYDSEWIAGDEQIVSQNQPQHPVTDDGDIQLHDDLLISDDEASYIASRSTTPNLNQAQEVEHGG